MLKKYLLFIASLSVLDCMLLWSFDDFMVQYATLFMMIMMMRWDRKSDERERSLCLFKVTKRVKITAMQKNYAKTSRRRTKQHEPNQNSSIVECWLLANGKIFKQIKTNVFVYKSTRHGFPKSLQEKNDWLALAIRDGFKITLVDIFTKLYHFVLLQCTFRITSIQPGFSAAIKNPTKWHAYDGLFTVFR